MTYVKFTSSRHRYIGLAIFSGAIAGLIAAWAKSGFEQLFPPRLATTLPPPQVLLNQLALHTQALNYHWMGYRIDLAGQSVHLIFSMLMAMMYCVLVEYCARVQCLHGLLFGLAVLFLAHGVFLPVLGLSVSLWHEATQAVISELVGTAVWIWTIEAIRQHLYQLMLKRS